MKRLRVWIGSLVAFSFVGFGIAIVFQRTDAPVLVPIIYAATGAFLVAAAIIVFAISCWEPFGRSKRNGS